MGHPRAPSDRLEVASSDRARRSTRMRSRLVTVLMAAGCGDPSMAVDAGPGSSDAEARVPPTLSLTADNYWIENIAVHGDYVIHDDRGRDGEYSAWYQMPKEGGEDEY